MYRPPSAGGGRSGPGVSADGCDGAQTLFGQAKGLAGELGLAGGADQAAQAKAAVDAYMVARDGVSPGAEALAHNGQVPNEFPQIDLKGDGTGIRDGSSPLSEIGKAVSELMSQMGDMLNQMFSGPMGVLGSILGFLFKLFSEIAGSIGQALSEIANAVACAVEETWKKQMEAAASTASQAGLQPLELYNQAAVTQTLSVALKNSAST